MKPTSTIPHLVTLALLLAATIAAGQTPVAAAASAAARHSEHGRAAGCTTMALACASAVGAAFDPRGRLWLAWVAGGAVSVARSADDAASFTEPVVVGVHGASLDTGADARPQIVVDARGRVAVAYGLFKDKAYNAQVMVATSADDGATFSQPRSISKHPASQRFPALVVAPDGATLLAVWLDKRTVAAARQGGGQQPGAALAVAWSQDGGASFSGERIVQDHSCECCRLAVAFDERQRARVLYRAIFDGRERDHALVSVSPTDAPADRVRLADDHWAIDGCPHQGPSLAASPAGTLHAAWFTLGSARQGLFYARSVDAGATFSAPRAVGHAPSQPGRPFLLVDQSIVWLVWKEFDGRRITIKQSVSHDDGRSWSDDRVVAQSADTADHPMLIRDARGVFLSWMTRAEGYRLLRLEAPR